MVLNEIERQTRPFLLREISPKGSLIDVLKLPS